MNSLRSETFLKPGFALISVLALVSLAALTATAFLASARLERTATRSIGDTTRLNMALNVGVESATKSLKFIVGDPPRPWNFVTTYWRTNSTDEVGYLFVGKAVASTTLNWAYVCGFTPSSWTNLSADLMSSNIIFTNTVCQATFSNDASTFMSTKGNLNFSPDPENSDLKCTRIDMIGGRKSPPVGWVYIKQDIRTNPSSASTAYLPVVRFAYFTEDLSALIDVDRMGGSTARSSGAATGTNAEEISLANLTGVTFTNFSIYTNNRPQYLTPGMLLSTNGGFLMNTNDLRYFASRLPKCLWTTKYTNYDRIPYVPISATPPYYPTNTAVTNAKIGAGALKYPLTDLTLGGQSEIAAAITNSFPMFTNRAGGMDGRLYVNALAANIVDYADADSAPTIVNVGGVNAVGYDSYPLLTHLYDQFLYSSNTRTITHMTSMQFWNPSTQSTAAGNITVNFTNKDTVRYTNNAVPSVVTNRPIVTNIVGLVTGVTSVTFLVPAISANAGYVTNFTRPLINLGNAANFPNFRPLGDPLIANLYMNTTTAEPPSIALPCNNSFSYQWGGATFAPAMTIKRQNNNLNNGVPINCAGFLAGNLYIPVGAQQPVPLPIHDPRMTPYLGRGSANQYFESAYATTCWRGYVSQNNPPFGPADPAFWPDAAIRNITSHGTNGSLYPAGPATGLFTNSNTTTGMDPIFCKISNAGSYTNIIELGNIFDPIQWRSQIPLAQYNFSNTNIGSTWTADSLYGGGSTLRIGRPEHSRFAFTNLSANTADYPVPSLGTSAVGLLDLFCIAKTYDWAGKINLNTAPLPVLAALAGGINLKTANYNGPPPADMIRAFTNGVVKFRRTYPFITPSQLAFISSDYGDSTTFHNSWPTNAVFATNTPTGFIPGGLQGPTAMNDESREEWFSKIYNLTCVQSFNYRIYVVAQLTDTNGSPKGAIMRKYYNLYLNNNTPNVSGGNPDLSTPSISPIILSETAY
jgi:hypothetical protein